MGINKYGSESSGGFPSKLEAAVYQKLKDREVLGLITEVKRQQSIILQDGPQSERITIRIDFTYIDKASGTLWAVEAKGFPTDVYKLKLKLWRKLKPLPLEIWTGSYKNPKCTEVIQ